jgi:biotin carboxyl carrier protein
MSNYYIKIGGRELGFKVSHSAGHANIAVIDETADQEPVPVDLTPVHSNPQTGEGLYSLLIRNKSYQLYLTPGKPTGTVEISRHRLELSVLTEREWRLEKIAPKEAMITGVTTVSAPMPGLVKSVLVVKGDEVKVGSRLLVLEAMKMENDILSPRDGHVLAVHVTAGIVADGGKALVDIE